MFKKVALFVLVAAVAYGAAEIAFDRFAAFRPMLIIKGFYVGPDTGTGKVQSNDRNKLTAIRFVDLDQDFPAIGGTGATTQCRETGVFTATGVKYGDLCSATTSFGMDGGAEAHVDVSFSCRAKTNGVVLKACTSILDGGNINLEDAGYTLEIHSNRRQ